MTIEENNFKIRKKPRNFDEIEKLELLNLNVLLVDDSIVRGNTSKQIIQMARDAGAKKVYFASASPPIKYPNVYGIDMPYVKELIAHGRTIEEIADKIGADKLIYQDLDGKDGGQGYFHITPNPTKYQGRQIQGVDLHEHLLETPYTYTHGLNTANIKPSATNKDNFNYQDLDIDIRNTTPTQYINNLPR